MASERVAGGRAPGGAGAVTVSALMTVIFALLIAEAAQLRPEARLAPLVVGIPALALALTQLFIETRATVLRSRSGDVGRGAPLGTRGHEARRAVALFGWLLALLVLCVTFGVIVAFPVFIFAFLRWREAESLVISSALALGFTVAVYAVFERLLDLPLWRGLAPTLFH